MNCPHLQECKQLIAKEDLALCQGKIKDWDFEDCHKFKDLASEAQYKDVKRPREPRRWLGLLVKEATA